VARTAIVTGVSKGIGKAIADRLLEEGYDVAGCSRDGDAAAAALAAGGEHAVGIAADVSRPDDVERLVETAVDRFGRVDVLVNNAGIYAEVDFLDLTLEQWNQTLAINLTGPMLCAQAAARRMIESGAEGRIVNIASSTGILAEAASADYNATKAALISLTRSLAVDLAPHGIITSCVAPGWIDTGIDPVVADLSPEASARLNPLGRTGTPEEVAHAVAALCDRRASFANGAVLSIDGGQTAVSPAPEL